MIRRRSNKKQKVAAVKLVVVSRDDDDAVVVVASRSRCRLMALPIPIRLIIWNYLGETQEELRTLPVLSKQVYADCNRRGIEWELIPLFLLRPAHNNKDDRGRTLSFIQNLYQLLHHDDTNNKLQRYRRMVVKDPHKFTHWGPARDILNMIRTMFNHQQLGGVVSLSITYSTRAKYVCSSLLVCLSCLLPNLREIDLSKTFTKIDGLATFIQNCPHLEKITLNNNNPELSNNNNVKRTAGLHLDGRAMEPLNNLRDITIDDSTFSGGRFDINKMSNLEQHDDIFLFHKCCKVLERVSIRNTTQTLTQPVNFPQNALIKFVRNAPSTLVWFRSDLTQENISMLQNERPNIEFLN